MQSTITVLSDAECSAITPTDSDRCFGSLSTERGHLPLEAMDVRAHVVGLSYRLVLRQTFANNLGAPLEANYIFPLPPRAAVTEFRMRVEDREVVGEIQERGQARATYNQAIASGHRAAIAEEDRSGVFTMRVGNILAGERAEVELVLAGPLEIEGATATFRFPLVLAPRYIPGTPLGGENVGAGTAADTNVVPDASRITPPVLLRGYPSPVRLSMRVELDAGGLQIENLRSALHAVVVDQRRGARVIELQQGERLNRDFILRFDIATSELASSLIACPDEGGDGGTFCLTSVPPKGAIAGSKPRDVVFVLDRSGSMGGWKMLAARRAVARMIDSLGSGDRFSVRAFDNTTETCAALGEGLVAATDRNRYRAVEFLAGLEARGGTAMYEPLLSAARTLGSGYRDRERVMVLVTDGQVGNEDQILRDLQTSLGCRLFAVGIDRAVNAGFLQRLAALGAGSCSLVESEDRLDQVMDSLARRIGEPVITEMAIAGDGFEIDAQSLVPRRIPDLFASSPTVVFGRYRGKIGGTAVVTGTDIGGGRYRHELSPQSKAASALASIWARGQIRVLEDDYVLGRENKNELAASILGLSLRHKVLSRFTAFVAVDRAVIANPTGRVASVVQPLELPEGWVGAEDDAEEMSNFLDAGEGSVALRGDALAKRELHFDRASVPAKTVAKPLGRSQRARGERFGGPPMQEASVPEPAPAPSSPKAPSAPVASTAGPASPSLPPAPRSAPSAANGIMSFAKKLRSRARRTPASSPKRDAIRQDTASISAESLIARIEQIALRHQGRSWLESVIRLARLLIELDELISDLRSLGAPAVLVDRIGRTRAALQTGGDGEVARILSELTDELGASRGGQSAPPSRADESFWR